MPSYLWLFRLSALFTTRTVAFSRSPGQAWTHISRPGERHFNYFVTTANYSCHSRFLEVKEIIFYPLYVWGDFFFIGFLEPASVPDAHPLVSRCCDWLGNATTMALNNCTKTGSNSSALPFSTLISRQGWTAVLFLWSVFYFSGFESWLQPICSFYEEQ